MRLSDANLRGRSVIGSDGRAIGEVAAIFIDTVDWGVESLHVKLRRDVADELGASRGLFHAGTVGVPTRLIQSVGDAVVLSVTKDGLRKGTPPEGPTAAAP